MKKLLILFFIIFLMSCSQSDKNRDEEQSLISESESFFQKALIAEEPEKSEYFSRAALLLEKTIKENDLNNGYIYYNAANAWLNSGNIGKAIVNYKKAMKRIPSNSNIKNNLELARAEVVNRIERNEENPIIKALFFIHYDLSFKSRFIILIVLLVLIIGSNSILLFLQSKIAKNFIFIMSIIFLIFAISIVIDAVSDKEGVIISREVIARKGDSEGYDNSFTQPLTEGVEFKLLTERQGWLFIELTDGRPCWIPGSSAELID